MRKIESIEEIKLIQLDILSALDRFCAEANIAYSIIDGTLLGAVRHKGYIPWDDDIDVAMTRPNYERFVKEFPAIYDGIYKFISLERNGKWDRAYGCMYDNRTQLTYPNNRSFAPGVLIDIFPVDEVPDKINEWKKVERKIRLYSKILALKGFTTFTVSKSMAKNIIAFFSRIVLKPVSRRRVAMWIDTLAKSNNGKGYTYGYEVAFGLGASNRFHMEDFNQISEYPFEGRVFKGLKNAHSVLSDIYGNYMELPPEEKRISHHNFNAYWK